MFLFEQEQFYSFLTPYNGITWQQSIDITPDERCGECHRKIFKAGKTHSRHAPAEAACNDCHVPTTTKDGQRYSVHDHKFDYSGPELPCAECHDLSDKTDRYFKDPGRRHKFRFARVKTQGPLTIPQACARCHKNMDVAKVLGEWKHGGD
jgi:formate-dependent nitrite reductase cytochrome c552 subunit